MESNVQYRGSIQVALIRQLQAEAGLEPCYATTATNRCGKTDCCWRFDCYDESGDAMDALVYSHASADKSAVGLRESTY